MKKLFLEFEDEDIAEKAKGMLALITKERQRIEKAGADYIGYLELALGLWIKAYMTATLPLMKSGNLKPAKRGGKSGFEFIEREIVRIAKEKYKKKHFKEIDRLIKKGYKRESAYAEAAKKFGFLSAEGMGKQYNKRHLDEKIIPNKKKGEQ